MLDAIHRSATPESSTLRSAQASDTVLASLLTMSSDREFSKALFQLLGMAMDAPEPAPSVKPSEPKEPAQGFSFPDRLSPSDGFAACQRSRDGPF